MSPAQDDEHGIWFTVPKLPLNAAERDAAGLPLGVVVQPFAPLAAPAAADQSQSTTALEADTVPRCGECSAYICGFCQLEREGWVCALCGRFTKFTKPVRDRYRRSTRRVDLPELAGPVYECLVASQTVHWQTAPLSARPVYIAVVDTCTDDACADAMRTALHAALLAAGPHALFGMITVARRVTLWDVRACPPSLNHVPLTRGGPSGRVSVPLADVMPLQAFLADISTCRDAIESAIDTLRPATQTERARVDEDQSTDGDACAFGPALDALLAYLGAAAPDDTMPTAVPGVQPAPQFPVVRVLCCLAGPPSVGIGSVDMSRWKDAQGSVFPTVGMPHSDTSLFGEDSHPLLDAAAAAADELAVPSTDFYATAATRAAGAGIIIDIFALPPAPPTLGAPAVYMDLSTIAPLAKGTGGLLTYYAPAQHHREPKAGVASGPHPLTRDVRRAVSGSCGMHATLRLRCSPELRPARAYGAFVDHSVAGVERGDDVHHIGACGPYDAVVFDLEFLSSQGLHVPLPVEQLPAVQAAFEYTVIVPLDLSLHAEESDDDADDTDKPAAVPTPQTPCFVRQRRRRIITKPAQLARSTRAMYDSCDAASVTCVLIHKALHAASLRGTSDARHMLVDWMALVASTCSGLTPPSGAPAGPSNGLHAPPDPTCATCPALRAMPRLVFGVLASPLLWPLRSHPDLRAVSMSLATSLNPRHCALWAYPTLTPWTDVDTEVSDQAGGLPLSRSAMAFAGGAPLFILDAFHTIIVYHAPVAPGQEQQPMPPPLGTLLRAKVNELRDSRGITPRVLHLRGGVDDIAPLEAALLDEGGACVDGDASLGKFLHAVMLAASTSETSATDE